MLPLEELLPMVVSIACEAGDAIIDIKAQSKDLNIQEKSDHSPVTIADMTANNIITEALKAITPDIPILSEEGGEISTQERLNWKKCWVVDPLDGTRGFIQGSPEYTVNIALIEGNQPIMGVIYAPELDQKLYQALRGQGAFLNDQPLEISKYDPDLLKVAVSQFHRSKWLETVLNKAPNHELIRMNSSMKLGLVSEGLADIYPRLGPTSEWDTAAGQCIVEEAGGLVVDLNGQTLQYNARTTLENPSFMAIANPSRLAEFLEIMECVRRVS